MQSDRPYGLHCLKRCIEAHMCTDINPIEQDNGNGRIA